MPPKNETVETEAPEKAPSLSAGFHVMLNGESLGCYPSADEAEAFANAHPRADGKTVEVVEVKG